MATLSHLYSALHPLPVSHTGIVVVSIELYLLYGADMTKKSTICEMQMLVSGQI